MCNYIVIRLRVYNQWENVLLGALTDLVFKVILAGMIDVSHYGVNNGD